MAWYNKYRPTDFDSVIGQELAKSVLQNSLKSGKLKHGYLFCGGKGVGKTTLARIFAGQLNKTQENSGSTIDIVEMDAASNTGVDDIRELIDFAQNPPISGEYKIYIIDEVHMLSKSAMNALLKILEEPPSYLIFLLATTNPEKILPTVLSRLTRLNLNSHSQKDLVTNLKYIANLEKVNIDADSLSLIAKRSDGSQRDAINLLETVAGYELTSYDCDTTARLLGMLPETLLLKIADTLVEMKSPQTLISLLQNLETTTIDGELFLGQMLEILLDISLNGNTIYDELILAISQVLELKLNLTYIPSTIALLSIYLKKSQPLSTNNHQVSDKVLAKSSKEIVKKIKEDNDIKPVSDDEQKPMENNEKSSSEQDNLAGENTNSDEFQEIFSSPLITETDTKEEILFDSKTQTQEQETNVADLSVDILQHFLTNLSKKEDVIPMFKMIAGDILVEQILDNHLIISVSSPIFLSNLKSPKLKDYVSEQIKEKFGNDKFLEIIQRQKNNTQKQNSRSTETKNSTQEEVSDKEIFYSIYKKAPENLQQQIPIKTEEIKIPPNNKGDWENSVNNMFEFED